MFGCTAEHLKRTASLPQKHVVKSGASLGSLHSPSCWRCVSGETLANRRQDRQRGKGLMHRKLCGVGVRSQIQSIQSRRESWKVGTETWRGQAERGWETIKLNWFEFYSYFSAGRLVSWRRRMMRDGMKEGEKVWEEEKETKRRTGWIGVFGLWGGGKLRIKCSSASNGKVDGQTDRRREPASLLQLLIYSDCSAVFPQIKTRPRTVFPHTQTQMHVHSTTQLYSNLIAVCTNEGTQKKEEMQSGCSWGGNVAVGLCFHINAHLYVDCNYPPWLKSGLHLLYRFMRPYHIIHHPQLQYWGALLY